MSSGSTRGRVVRRVVRYLKREKSGALAGSQWCVQEKRVWSMWIYKSTWEKFVAVMW